MRRTAKEIQMLFHAIVFYCFSALLIVASIVVIVSRNPVHAAMFLVLAFFRAPSCGYWLKRNF